MYRWGACLKEELMADALKNDSLTGVQNTDELVTAKYLIFDLGAESYGLEIFHVNEIIGVQTITEVPEQPEYVKGIINLRGKIIPVLDVRLRFKKEARAYDERTCIIVVDIQDLLVGLIIDRVVEVVDILLSQIAPPPKLNNDFKNRYIKGIGKTDNGVKLLLDCNRLLLDEEIDGLMEMELK